MKSYLVFDDTARDYYTGRHTLEWFNEKIQVKIKDLKIGQVVMISATVGIIREK